MELENGQKRESGREIRQQQCCVSGALGLVVKRI